METSSPPHPAIDLATHLYYQLVSTLTDVLPPPRIGTSLSVHGRLMRVQAVRQKREAIEGTASQDAWTLHAAERSIP